MTTLQNIRGLPDLEKRLRELPEKLERKILRQALRQGANVILRDARARVPVKSGALQKSLRVSTSARRGQVRAKIVAGSNKKGGAFYAHIVEGGAKAHVIKGRKGKRLAFGAKLIYPTQVRHPGARAQPFLRPALEQSANAAVEAVAAEIRRRLDEVVR